MKDVEKLVDRIVAMIEMRKLNLKNHKMNIKEIIQGCIEEYLRNRGLKKED